MRGDEESGDVRRFELLASALAGREVKIQPVPAGQPAWTDGVRIFVDASAPPAERLRMIAVQACLIAAGSLEPDMARRLGRRSALARRYLTVEGHRAIAASATLLPPPLRSLVDVAAGRRSISPDESLAVASGREPISAPPRHFGVLRPRKLLEANGSTLDQGPEGTHRPRHGNAAELAELDDDGCPTGIEDPFTSPVGGGGAIGRLLQRLLGAARQLGGGGTPGADSATDRPRIGGRPGVAVFSAAGVLTDDRDMAGSPPDERVYVDSRPLRRDLAVLVLLDVSGSAAEPGTLGHTVHEQQRLVAATLTVALHELGDRVALYAYHSQGRSAVNVLPVKRFGDHLDALTIQRLNGLRPGAYSRLGAAIRHGTAVIADRGATSHRLLVVVSDGLAYDHGYERAYGAADARRALAEARRQGIGCLCLTVGAATDDNDLRRVFGGAAHAAIPKPARLGDVIGPLFRSALRFADTRRKVS